MVNLSKEVQYIKTVGPSRAELLNKLGIFTLKDLITYFPREYEDRGKVKKICECIDGEMALIEAVVVSRIVEIRMRGKSMYKLQLRDETGTCTALWFNQSYLKNIFKPGEKYKFYGKIASQYGRVEIASPVFDKENAERNTGKIIPIYPLTKNLTQNVLRKIIELGLSEVEDELEETLPEYILEKYKLMSLNETIKKIHFPDQLEDFEKARRRLAFEELLIMQLALLELKNSYISEKNGIAFDKEVKISEVINELPFKLTKAQLRVLEEIELNMESSKEMNRLLQGDVGSGKTVVAILAAYKAVKS